MSQICAEYLRLFKALQEAIAKHTQLVEDLSNAASCADDDAFRRCWVVCEADRRVVNRALITLHVHIVEHQCIDPIFMNLVSAVQK